jgi:tRNA(His) 5'-end guanylyltransferase
MENKIMERMKDFYEDRTRYKLTRRTNTIIRVDGKAFHTYTKGLQRPFDPGLMEDMDKTAEYLCQNIQGAKFGYVQSDEISILITDYDDISTHAWFDANLQKMASIAASLATAEFNRLRLIRKMNTTVATAGSILEQFKHAMFDARVFQIPYQEEVINYFIWRQQDATRNSISSVAQSLYSAKELHGKKTSDMQEMIFQKGINWNDFTPREKRGSIIRKVEKTFEKPAHWAYGEGVFDSKFTRTKWEADPNTPIISQDKSYLRWRMPKSQDDKTPVL